MFKAPLLAFHFISIIIHSFGKIIISRTDRFNIFWDRKGVDKLIIQHLLITLQIYPVTFLYVCIISTFENIYGGGSNHYNTLEADCEFANELACIRVLIMSLRICNSNKLLLDTVKALNFPFYVYTVGFLAANFEFS